MTPQEHRMLDDFLDRLARVGSVAKDSAADALIRERLAVQPDAPYLLVQRALLLQQALDDAQRQIAQLKQATAQAPAEGSFLSPAPAPEPGFGRAPSQTYMPPPAGFPPAAAVQPPSAPVGGWRERLFGAPPSAGQPPTAPLQAAPAGGGSGFLGQAAATAAGVAGGMFLFNGLQHWGEHAGGAAKNLVDGSPLAAATAGGHDDPANQRIGDALGPRDDASAGSGSASPFLSDNGDYADASRQTAVDDGSGSWLVDDGGFADDDGDNFI
jgi:hypothetical protein